MKPSASVADRPSGFISTMSAGPGSRGPVVAVRLFESETSTCTTGAPPIVKVEPGKKFTPVMATAVPPEDAPDVGRMASIRGSATPELATSGESIFAASCPMMRCPAMLGWMPSSPKPAAKRLTSPVCASTASKSITPLTFAWCRIQSLTAIRVATTVA